MRLTNVTDGKDQCEAGDMQVTDLYTALIKFGFIYVMTMPTAKLNGDDIG